MELIEIGPWKIRVDREKTNSYYQQFQGRIDDCFCEDCATYVNGITQFPPAYDELFLSLGIDPAKEGEVFVIDEKQVNCKRYMGFYHFIGEILATPASDEDFYYQIEKVGNFDIGFTEEVDLVPSDFPLPIVQLVFEMDVMIHTKYEVLTRDKAAEER
ncbi:hypothetical protein [Sporosarcina obsidiansis]|uniref:hypothetical protein n=1 Tax=Sporosarcina obsidiansis TaxID=2660748 RepID=UPI00129B2307|nr:hypothetical protein [Sporosarcina obsidiansis]